MQHKSDEFYRAVNRLEHRAHEIDALPMLSKIAPAIALAKETSVLVKGMLEHIQKLEGGPHG